MSWAGKATALILVSQMETNTKQKAPGLNGERQQKLVEPPVSTPRMARSWQSGRVPGDWKKANVMLILEKGNYGPGNCRMINYISNHVAIKGQILLEAIIRHVKSKR